MISITTEFISVSAIRLTSFSLKLGVPATHDVIYIAFTGTGSETCSITSLSSLVSISSTASLKLSFLVALSLEATLYSTDVSSGSAT